MNALDDALSQALGQARGRAVDMPAMRERVWRALRRA